MPDGNKTLEEQKKEFLDEALKANKQDKKEVGMAKKKVNSELSPLSLEQVQEKYTEAGKNYQKHYSDFINRAKEGDVAKPDENMTIFSDKMNYDAFLKFLREKVKFKYNEKISEDNNLTRAMFYMLRHDKTGAAEEIIKKVDAGIYSEQRKIYNACLLCVKGEENTLNENEKKSLQILNETKEIAHGLMIDAAVWSVSKNTLSAKKLNKNTITLNPKTTTVTNDKRIINEPPKVTINNNIINEPPKTTINNNIILNTTTTTNRANNNNNNYINNNRINVRNRVKPFMPDGSILITNQDIINLAATINRRGFGTEMTSKAMLDIVLPTLNNNAQRLEFYLNMMNSEDAPEAWEYSGINHLPSEIRTCGNLEELREYYAENADLLPPNAKAVMIRRMHSIELSKKIINANEKSRMDFQTLGDVIKPAPAPKYDWSKNAHLTLSMPKKQSSGCGCWSCGLQMLLLSHGINVSQEDIRAYRPDIPKEVRKNASFKKDYDEELRKDDFKNALEMGDSALAFAPDRMLRNFEIQRPGRAQEYYGVEEKIDEKKYIAAATKAAAAKIQQVLNEDKCTLSFTNGVHYYAIKSIDGNTITCLNSSTGRESKLKLDETIRDIFNGAYTLGRQADFSLVWMSKIELAEDGKNFLNVPSHYLSMNDDGSLNLPPAVVHTESEQTKFERDGIRVKLVGGKDDTEYERINRNPLTKDNLLIIEQAYLPKQLNANTLRRNMQARSKAETEALKRQKANLLGTDFKAPKYTLSEDEMRQLTTKRKIILSKTDLLVEFEENNGFFELKEKEKRDSKGRELLVNKPGAILAFRIQKAYEGFKDLYTYMANSTGNEYWSKHLLDIEARYKDFMQRINKPENAINEKTEIVPKVYPLNGYLKSREDLTEGISFLHSMTDKILIKNFGAERYRTISNKNKYNPSVLSRFAENIKEFANPKNKGNLLKICEQNPFFNDGVNAMLKMPTTNAQILNERFKPTKNKYIVGYFNFCANMANGVANGKSSYLQNPYNNFKSLISQPQAGTYLPNVRKNFVPAQKGEVVGELKVIPKNYIPNNGYQVERDDISVKSDDKDAPNVNFLDEIDPNLKGINPNPNPNPIPNPEVGPKPEVNPNPNPIPNPEVGPKPEVNPNPNPIPNPEPEPKKDDNINPTGEKGGEEKPGPNPEAGPKPGPEPEVNPNPNPIPDPIKIDNIIKPEDKESEKDSPLTRTLKRRSQYKSFLQQLEKETLNIDEADALSRLGKLVEDLDPYIEPNTQKRLSFNQLKEFMDRYVQIQNDLDSYEKGTLAGNDAYQKFRQVMSKDIRTIYDVIRKNEKLSAEEKAQARFSMVEIFEESRSIEVTVEEKDIEKEGGNLSQRLHIVTVDDKKQPVDGYFTIHEKNFNKEEASLKHLEEFAGSKDPLAIEYARYLLCYNPKGKNSFVKKLQVQKSEVAKTDTIRLSFPDSKSYAQAFRNEIKKDLRYFAMSKNIPMDGEQYKLLENITNRYSKDIGSVDDLTEGLHAQFLINNKAGIYEDCGINPKSAVDKRNSAMYAVAELLGIENVLAKSKNMRLRIGDKVYKGTFMDKAEGTTLNKLTTDCDLAKITSYQLEDNPELKKAIANLQVLDLICGNTDRNINNLSFVAKNGKLFTVQGIDNDNSFGDLVTDLQANDMKSIPFDNMTFIPQDTADAIRDLDLNLLRAVLIGYDLTKKEIDAHIDRVRKVQEKISRCMEDNEKAEKKSRKEKVKILSDEEISKLAFSDDLCRPPYGMNKDKDYNLFSRIESQFGRDDHGRDKISRSLMTNLQKASREFQHKASVAEERMRDTTKVLNEQAKAVTVNQNEYKAMTDATTALFNAYAKAPKNVLERSSANKKMMECSRKFGPLYESAKNCLDQTNAFVEKQKQTVAALQVGTDEYRIQNEILQNALNHQKQVTQFTNAYKELTGQPAKFDAILALGQERWKIWKAGDDKEVEKLNEELNGDRIENNTNPNPNPVITTEENPNPNPVITTEEKPNPNPVITTEEKPNPEIKNDKEINTGDNKIETEGEPKKKEKPTQEEVDSAKSFLVEANTYVNCLNGICSRLEDIREQLKTDGAKTNNAKDYTKDGTTEYQAMATHLENTINLLRDPNSDPAAIESSLKNLRNASAKYFTDRYGTYGFPIHPSGRVRLSCSGELMNEVLPMLTVIGNCRRRLNDLIPEANYGDSSIHDIEQYGSHVFERCGEELQDAEIRSRSYERERRVPNIQLRAFEKLREINREVYEYYNPENIDNLKKIIDKWGGNVSNPLRAEVYVVADTMNRILKPGIDAEKAQRLLDNFTGYNCSMKAKKLAEYDLFKKVQRTCSKNKPDNGFSTWAMIEEGADSLHDEYEIKKLRNGSDYIVSANIITANNASPDSDNPEQSAKDNLYEATAEILVNKALSDPAGRKVLHMMAMERSDAKADLLKSYTIAYLKRKDPFYSKGEFKPEKISDYITSDVHKKILKSFYNQRPNVELKFEGDYRAMPNKAPEDALNKSVNSNVILTGVPKI